MSLLFPRLSPLQTVSLIASFIVCWLFGESPDGSVLFSVFDPVSATIIASGALLSSAVAPIAKGIAEKRARKRYDKSPEGRAQRREDRKADRRLRKGQYGHSRARKRQKVEEAHRGYQAQTKAAAADVTRAAATGGPFGAGAARKHTEALSEGAQDVAATARMQAEGESSADAIQREAMDRATVRSSAQQRQAREMGQATTAGQTAAGFGQAGAQTLTGPAQAGAFDKPAAPDVDATGDKVAGRAPPAATPVPVGS